MTFTAAMYTANVLAFKRRSIMTEAFTMIAKYKGR